jgi:hypothetical protein
MTASGAADSRACPHQPGPRIPWVAARASRDARRARPHPGGQAPARDPRARPHLGGRFARASSALPAGGRSSCRRRRTPPQPTSQVPPAPPRRGRRTERAVAGTRLCRASSVRGSLPDSPGWPTVRTEPCGVHAGSGDRRVRASPSRSSSNPPRPATRRRSRGSTGRGSRSGLRRSRLGPRKQPRSQRISLPESSP